MGKRVEEHLAMLLGDLGEVTVQEQNLQNILNGRLESPLQEHPQSPLKWPAEKLQIHMEKSVDKNLEKLIGDLGELTIPKRSLQNILKDHLEVPLQELNRSLLDGLSENLQIYMEKEVEANLEMLLGDLGEMTVQEMIIQNILKEHLDNQLQKLPRAILNWLPENLQIHMEKSVEANLEMLLGDLGEVTVQKRILQIILEGLVERPLQELPRALLKWPAENLQIHMEKKVEENLEMVLGDLGEVTVQDLILQNILKGRLENQLQHLTQSLLKWPAEKLQINMKKRVEEHLDSPLGDLGETTVQELILQNILKERMERPLQEFPRALLKWTAEHLQVHMEKELEENLAMLLGNLGAVTVQELSLHNILKEHLERPLQELPRTLLKWPAENLQIHMEKEVEENLEMLLGDLGELTVQKLSLQNILNGRVERTLQELPRTFLNWPAENLQIYMEKRVEENLEMALG
ncbi:Ribosomal protein S6 kinase alpha-2, related [Eimeria necatrix]|uniref:Ribosomal protein S6 kinase alpha-2, related n=1 Tax=Eimeria necatrix TaxID=51315 RepID=U6MP07_9EIME|nr:Ribosomal protein S6 kinase alpha-2, related [Eimeria necatrix]CDJ65746.1 Ribosomal protein S6 kinase alpha-2, related [Eimeria necatrix]